jgi:uncharacterized protein involved in exopolysaccharide biosynthesis
MRKLTDDTQDNSSKLNLTEIWRVAWRKKYLLLVPLLIPLVVTLIGVRFLVPVFEASSIIRMEDKNLLTREMERYIQFQDRRRMHDREAEARIKSELATSKFLDELIDRLGMDKDPKILKWAERQRANRFPDLSVRELVHRKLRGRVKKTISVERVGPGMFKISAFHFDPEICYVIANAVTELFIQNQKKKQIEGLQEASDFSDEHLVLYKERLEKSEQELDRFKKKMNRLKMKVIPVGERNLGYAETLLKQIEIKINDGRGILGKIESNLVALFGSVPKSSVLDGDGELRKIRTQLLAQFETQLLLELGARGEKTDELRESVSDITSTGEALQKRLAEVVPRAFPDIYKDYYPLIVEFYYQKTMVEGYEKKKTSLKGYINDYKQKLELEPQWERQLAKLREEVQLNKDLYNSFLKAKTSTQISESAQNTNLGLTIEVVEKARKPMSPVRPNKPKIIIIAILFGGFLGVGSLIVSEFVDTSFRSVEEIQRELGLKVLGTVPRFELNAEWGERGGFRRVLVWVAASLIIGGIAILGFYYYGKSSTGNRIEIYASQRVEDVK